MYNSFVHDCGFHRDYRSCEDKFVLQIIDVAKTDNTLANNGLPLALQRLRCKVAFHALRFAPHIRSLAEDMIQELKSRGPFVALHLRYEQDMLAFSGCTHGLTLAEIDNLTAVR